MSVYLLIIQGFVIVALSSNGSFGKFVMKSSFGNRFDDFSVCKMAFIAINCVCFISFGEFPN